MTFKSQMVGVSLALIEGGRIYRHQLVEIAPKLYLPDPEGEWVDSGEFVKITIHEPGSTNRKAYDRHAWRWTHPDGTVEVDANWQRLLGSCGIRGEVETREFPMSLFGPQAWRWEYDRVGFWEPVEKLS